MKFKFFSLHLIPILAIIRLTACSSTRTYQHQYSDQNRWIVRHVLEYGTTTSENCGLHGSGPAASDTIVEKDIYELTGKCALYTWHVKMKALDGGSKFEIDVKCSRLVGRNKTSEGYFLDEVGAALFEANKTSIKSTLDAEYRNSKQ